MGRLCMYIIMPYTNNFKDTHTLICIITTTGECLSIVYLPGATIMFKFLKSMEIYCIVYCTVLSLVHYVSHYYLLTLDDTTPLYLLFNHFNLLAVQLLTICRN